MVALSDVPATFIVMHTDSVVVVVAGTEVLHAPGKGITSSNGKLFGIIDTCRVASIRGVSSPKTELCRIHIEPYHSVAMSEHGATFCVMTERDVFHVCIHIYVFSLAF